MEQNAIQLFTEVLSHNAKCDPGMILFSAKAAWDFLGQPGKVSPAFAKEFVMFLKFKEKPVTQFGCHAVRYAKLLTQISSGDLSPTNTALMQIKQLTKSGFQKHVVLVVMTRNKRGLELL